MNVCLSGVGTSNFGARPELGEALVREAVHEAFEDAGVDPGDIDAAYVGTVFGWPGTGNRVTRAAGIVGVPVLTVENACASGTTALHLAIEAVASGATRCAVAIGVEKMTDRIAGAITPETDDLDGRAGMAMPALYAMTANRYLARFDVRLSDLAEVAVKNHGNAVANPRAQYGGDHTVQEVLESRPIADPLTLLQCSPISDGAGAVIVQRADDVPAGHGAVRVRASATTSGTSWPGPDDRAWNVELVERTAQQAYATAGITVEDLDVFEIHDAFTIGEIITTEGLGLAPEGGGARLVREGATRRDGRHPVNPSGGLLARGHPLGATGIAQVAEIVWQLTGRAGDRQVPDARLGLVETMGGNVAGLSGNGCVVAILERHSD